MKHEPLVSVIIPTYNSAKFVTKAIDSVLAQTYKKYEIIIVDDGSTDNTKKVLVPYIKKKKIKYIYQKNKRQGAARNNGIKHSKGELIALLDADDLWMPKKLKLQVPLFKDEEVGLVYGRSIKFKGNQVNIMERKHYSNKIFNKLILSNFIITSSVILRKETLNEIGNFNEKNSYANVEDYDLWLRISHDYKVKYVKQVIMNYRIHNNNSSNNNEEMDKKAEMVQQNILKKFKIGKNMRNKKKAYDYLHQGHWLLKNKKYNEAIMLLKRSLNLNHFDTATYKELTKAVILNKFKK